MTGWIDEATTIFQFGDEMSTPQDRSHVLDGDTCWCGPTVLSFGPEVESHAESFNEGHATAMAQTLADDPGAAEEWLARHDAELLSPLKPVIDHLNSLRDYPEDEPVWTDRDYLHYLGSLAEPASIHSRQGDDRG